MIEFTETENASVSLKRRMAGLASLENFQHPYPGQNFDPTGPIEAGELRRL
jgi:hypothetical protein